MLECRRHSNIGRSGIPCLTQRTLEVGNRRANRHARNANLFGGARSGTGCQTYVYAASIRRAALERGALDIFERRLVHGGVPVRLLSNRLHNRVVLLELVDQRACEKVFLRPAQRVGLALASILKGLQHSAQGCGAAATLCHQTRNPPVNAEGVASTPHQRCRAHRNRFNLFKVEGIERPHNPG